jgi:catechol 2,3-dioxygenase-like lactoylglutathione lyase family enzyme
VYTCDDRGMDVLFVSSFAVVVADPPASARLYRDALGIAFEATDDYLHTGDLEGVKHFGLWPLADVARSCFGTDTWPDDVPVPQASIEFEVADVAGAAAELEAAGYELLHGAKTEPWGQEIARLLSPEGLIVGVCWTPWFHDASDGRAGAG